MTTIKDVAREAGVSFKTVSRFVNGESNIRPELRKRIETAISALNYRPSLAARQLASNRTFIITLVIPHFFGSYFGRMMVSVAAECRAVGYHLVTEVYRPETDGQGRHRFPDFSVRSDAIILIPPYSDYAPLLSHLGKLGVPVVRVASIGDDDPERIIRVDDTQIAAELVDHLIGLGHRRIAMIAPPLPVKASETRVAGYRLALERAGIPFDADLLVRGDSKFASGVACATQLLALPNRPTAIFAATDYMALGALALARQLGYSVPEDVAIAGFDDSPESRMVSPPLTTVHQPIESIARAAVQRAIGRGSPAKPATGSEFGHRLVVRGSTTGSRDLCLEPYSF